MAKDNLYVVVDLETTGLDSNFDQIIEIGAVKIKRGLIIDTFSSLIKINQALPSKIIELTGIDDDMLYTAPPLGEVILAFEAFIGNSHLIAHNADFDSEFLSRVWADDRPWLDTIKLAQIAFPTLNSYSLANLCAALNIENQSAHRALGDALATAEVFINARRALDSLPPKAKADILLLAGEHISPLDDLLRKYLNADTLGLNLEQEQIPRYTPREIDETYQVPKALIQEFFGTGGIFEQNVEHFCYRNQQVIMADQVADSLNNKQFLLAEAGTGSGKSLAYLLPSALFALNSGQKVGISTHTKNLQEQLLKKDIPLLAAHLDQPLRTALLKGRSNYLCRRMYRANLHNTDQQIRFFMMRIASWQAQSLNGDGSELNIAYYDKWRWQRICAASENCDSGCTYFKGGCYVTKARRETERADIVVLNHALLIANATLEGGFLANLPYLVIDEAHHLEDVAEDQLTETVEFYQLLRLSGRISRRERGKQQGLLESLKRQVDDFVLSESKAELLDQHNQRIEENLESQIALAEAFFRQLQLIFSNLAAKELFFPAKIRLLNKHRQQAAWGDLELAGQSLAAAITATAKNLTLLADFYFHLQAENEINNREELNSLAAQFSQAALSINHWLAEPGDAQEIVCWLEFSAADKYPELKVAPLELGTLLNKCLYDNSEAIIFSSATMTTGQSFSYFKQRLGLDLITKPLQETVLPSPFNYQEQALFTICNNLPDWSKAEELKAQVAIATSLEHLILASKGRALVLFTSHYQLRAVNDLLKERLAEAGITLLAQGLSGQAGQLVSRLAKEDRCCIFGAASFWEGVDISGSALSLLVIVRLPFWPPNTPTLAARMEKIEQNGGSSFFEYSLPQAILRFKQGFGRLIRSIDDKGAFCVLDGRILSKGYGRNFIKSLPTMQMIRGSSEDLAKQIEDWLR